MASSGSNDCNSQLNNSIDKSHCKIHSSEHEETVKADQMATKKFDEEAHIEDFNETQLKSLLDEAINYKSPRDANDKSDTFKQLLKNVTEEDMKHNDFNLGNYGLKQSNSLQNLLDHSHYQLNCHQSHQSGKKHHQKSRKNSTSVSARRLEGGSLPIDMHHSSAAAQSSDQPFLREYKFKNRKQKESDNETDEKKLMQRHFDKDYISSSYPHDGIEMKSLSFTNSVDLEVQDVSRYSMPSASITTIASITAPLAAHSSSSSAPVDRAIEFRPLTSQPIEQIKSYQQAHQIIDTCPGSTINHNNNVILANHALDFSSRKLENASVQLSSQYQAVTSLTHEKAAKSYQKFSSLDTPSQTHIAPAQTIAASSHQSASLVNAKDPNSKTQKKRNLKTNEKTIEVKSMQGYRGEEELDVLLKYIEDGGGKNQKSHPKNGIVSGHQTSDHLLTAEEKKKKMAAKNKEKVNKLKKSNSMDELCSTGRHEQQQQQEKSAANKIIIQDVTLRSKSSNLTSGAKKGDKNEKSQQKRNERRSWGTEGLWTDTVEREIQDEQQEIESSSSCSSSGVPSEIAIDSAVTTVAIEPPAPIVTETEFHVVTKKRKVKRKSNEGVELNKTPHNLHSYNIKRDGNVRSGTRNYNDRDSGTKTARTSKPLNQDGKSSTSKNRRKSTSSMPPSDDDWNSDGGDSVQSLPIETTKTTSSQLLSTTSAVNENPSTGGKAKKSSNPPHQQKPATFSYADIAKTNASRNSGANVTASTEKWPSITASSSSTHQNNNDPFSIANFDAVSSQKTQLHQQKPTPSMMSFPELVETNNVKNKQLSNHPSEIASNGEPINTTEKPTNGLDMPRPFDSNNNNSNDDRVNNNQKISYSQSLLENHQNEVDTNGNSTKESRTLTKSKSVDQNNLSSIEHYPALEKAQVTLGEVFSPKAPVTFETYTSKSKQKQAKPEVKPTKKDKLKKSASVQGGPIFPQQNSLHNCRPAVIILQDSAKQTDTDFGDITFGFDINEHLLHGQQNGDIRDSLEQTNNNDNCDIINTNLSTNNNLSNQPCEMFDNFIAPQNIIIGDSHIMMLSQHSNVLDASNQSYSDVGYMSSSLLTTGSPPAIQHETVQSEPVVDAPEMKRIVKLDGYQLVLPQFISPEPIKFNQEELVSFVNGQWLDVLSKGVYFNGQ